MAEAYFSSLSAANALGDHTAVFDDARTLAGDLRGTTPTATVHIEQLERRGLRHLLNGKYPDAVRAFATAHNQARKAGNLSDFIQVTEELGDALAAAEHPAQALSAYVAAGAAKKSGEIAKGMLADAVLGTVELDSPRWQRGAAWAAIAGAGRHVSDGAAARLTPLALEEVRREPPRNFFANPSYYAADVLANVVCAVPTEKLDEVLGFLRDRLRMNIGDPKRLVEPLVAVTFAGVSDETEILVDVFLDERYGSASEHLVGQLIAERPDQAERVVTAAKEGYGPALDALALADLLEGDELLERARERVSAVVATPNKEVNTEGGTRTLSVGIGGSYAAEGLFARKCPDELRRSLTDKLLSIIRDQELPIMMRAGAVAGLDRLAAALPDEHVEEVANALERAAASEDVPASFDRIGHDNLLARFTVNMAPPEVLRSASLAALGELVEHRPEARERLAAVVPDALASSVDQLVLAALHTLEQHPWMELHGIPLQAFCVHPTAQLRVAAAGVLLARYDQGRDALVALMVQDADPLVRRAAIEAVDRYEARAETIAPLVQDPDCYNRVLARRVFTDAGSRKAA